MRKIAAVNATNIIPATPINKFCYAIYFCKVQA